MLPKVGQSLFLLTFEVVTFFTNWGLDDRLMPLPISTQKFLVNVLFFATIFEYLVLVVNLGFLIKDLIVNRKKKKPKFLEYKKTNPLAVEGQKGGKLGQIAMIGAGGASVAGVKRMAMLGNAKSKGVNQVHPLAEGTNSPSKFRDMAAGGVKKKKRRKKLDANGNVMRKKKKRTRKVKKSTKMQILKKKSVRQNQNGGGE